MASPRPPSIGDASSERFSLVKEEYPLPKSRQEVLAAVGRILNLGGVQRLAIRIGEPIQVYRAVSINGEVPTTLEELEADDLYAQVRNATMEAFEFKVKDQSSFEMLFVSFQTIAARGLIPKNFIVSNLKMLRAWLGVGALDSMTTIYGVPCLTHPDVPEDILLFAAASPESPDNVAFTLRLEMA